MTAEKEHPTSRVAEQVSLSKENSTRGWGTLLASSRECHGKTMAWGDVTPEGDPPSLTLWGMEDEK